MIANTTAVVNAFPLPPALRARSISVIENSRLPSVNAAGLTRVKTRRSYYWLRCNVGLCLGGPLFRNEWMTRMLEEPASGPSCPPEHPTTEKPHEPNSSSPKRHRRASQGGRDT